jgi:hypothetical protein
MADNPKRAISPCNGKITHPTARAAEKSMAAVIKRAGHKPHGRPHVYFCPQCSGYHWGHRGR